MCLELIYPKKNMVFGLLTPGCFRFSVSNPVFPLEPGFCPATHVFSDMETIGTVCYTLYVYIYGVS